jgi:hypothetical protein
MPPKSPKPVWDKKRPSSLGASKPLSDSAKSSAKRAAEKAGRPYPNLVDNMRAARRSK